MSVKFIDPVGRERRDLGSLESNLVAVGAHGHEVAPDDIGYGGWRQLSKTTSEKARLQVSRLVP